MKHRQNWKKLMHNNSRGFNMNNGREHCPKNSANECEGCKAFRQAAYRYYSNGKMGVHPSRDSPAYRCDNR